MGKNIEESINYKFGLYLIDFLFGRDEAKYQSELREQYSVDKLFNKNAKENVQTTALVEYKEPVYKKVLNGILAFFHLKNKWQIELYIEDQMKKVIM